MNGGICLAWLSTLLLNGRNAVNVGWSRQGLRFLIASGLSFAIGAASAQTPPASKKPTANAPAVVPLPNAPQSTHYPILLLAFGNSPSWDVRIGPKGPELFERAGYPPIVLEPGEISREGAVDAWTYRAKDTATGADVSVHLTREACSEAISSTGSAGTSLGASSGTSLGTSLGTPASSGASTASAAATATTPGTKYTFRAAVTHAQIGKLAGCARIAAELFPRMPNQSAQGDDDADKKDADKKKIPVLPPITASRPPVSVAFINPAGKIIFSRAGIKKIAAPSGVELSLAHDGKRLLYTRPDAKPSTLTTIVLYEFDTGRSRDLAHGMVGPAWWSPDDSRIAYLNTMEQKTQVWVMAPETPEKARLFSPQMAISLFGWVDSHTVIVSDAGNAYWLSEDKPEQTLSLAEIYGDGFKEQPSDTLCVNPVNPDLLLVSATYQTPPTGAPLDAEGRAYGFFLYELRSKRRVTLSPPDELARTAEWSRDGIQVFFTRHSSSAPPVIYRIFWDGSGLRRYAEGGNLVVGQ
jgi:hypothetical protein